MAQAERHLAEIKNKLSKIVMMKLYIQGKIYQIWNLIVNNLYYLQLVHKNM